jgi:UDPglucose 6-dehydrogenase
MRQANPHLSPAIACVPENLRLGRAIARFMNPAMLVIGADEPSILDRVDAFLSVVQGVRLRTNLRTAEMTKHALNAFFATCISFANELGNLCDDLGADGVKVAEALRLDERIGPSALVFPGAPFGGGTLARDLRVLQALGKATGSETPLIDAVFRVNERQRVLAVKRLREFFGELRGLNVGVLGLTYKAGTSTLRRSQALDVIRQLTAAGAIVKAYDPKADVSELGDTRPCHICANAYEAAEGADAVVIATEWPEFRDLDFAELRSRLRRPVILDTKNLLDPEALAHAGFVYLGIGRGTTPGIQKR